MQIYMYISILFISLSYPIFIHIFPLVIWSSPNVHYHCPLHSVIVLREEHCDPVGGQARRRAVHGIRIVGRHTENKVRYGTVCSSLVRCGAVWHSVLRLFESNEEINFDSVWNVGVQLVGKVT